jgi:hypothetical protein
VNVLFKDMNRQLMVVGVMGIEVADRDQTQQLSLVIDDGQMADAAILEDATGLVEPGV